MKWVFWVSIGAVAYALVLYPLLAYARGRWRRRPVQKASIFPFVSIVMAVRNESEVLLQKLQSLAELNYPIDRYETLAVSDGSTDTTDQILGAQGKERLRVFLLPEHVGKTAALNCAVQAARGEVVVFTDARQRIDPDALAPLIANFADPSVGCVSGELVLRSSSGVASTDGHALYWATEKKIRQWESAAGSVVGATGALYAVRRELVVRLPAGTILDDVYIPLHVARQGKRVVFEPRSLVYDSVRGYRREFRRKVRTLTGNYQLLQLAPWLLSRSNPLLFAYVSHKLMRLMLPFALIGAFVASFFLPGRFYTMVFLLQLISYALAGLAVMRPRYAIVSRLANASLTFLTLTTAAAVALFYFVTGKKQVWMQ